MELHYTLFAKEVPKNTELEAVVIGDQPTTCARDNVSSRPRKSGAFM